MFLSNGEWLYSIEGGCFNKKTFHLFGSSFRKYDNEVLVLNAMHIPVASVVFGDPENSSMGNGILVDILEPSVDRPLIVAFALYVLRTS